MPGSWLFRISNKQMNGSYHVHYRKNFLDPSSHHGIMSVLILASSVGGSDKCSHQDVGFSPFISQSLVCSPRFLYPTASTWCPGQPLSWFVSQGRGSLETFVSVSRTRKQREYAPSSGSDMKSRQRVWAAPVYSHSHWGGGCVRRLSRFLLCSPVIMGTVQRRRPEL